MKHSTKSNHLKSPQNSSLNIRDDLPFDPASLLLLSSSSSAQLSSNTTTPPQQTKQPQKQKQQQQHQQHTQQSTSVSNKKEAEHANKSQFLANTSNTTNIINNNNNNNTNNLKATLENIELKMRIIASPNIRIADLFKCFLKNVPKSTETIEVGFIFVLIVLNFFFFKLFVLQ